MAALWSQGFLRWARPPAACADETVLRIAASPEAAAALAPVVAAYVRRDPPLSIRFSPPGAGGVIPELLRGDADAAVLSRPVSEPEFTVARKSDQPELRGYPFALEGAAVVVHPANPLNDITLEQIGALLGQSLVTWQQLGVKTTGTALEVKPPRRKSDPSASVEETASPIQVLIPGRRLEAVEWLRRRTAGQVQISNRLRPVESDAEILQTMRDQPLALSFVRLPVPSGLKALAVRERTSAPAVIPTPISVSTREYPLTHYVYLYTLGVPPADLRDFIAFLLGPNGQRALSSEGGMQPIPILAVPEAAGVP